MNRPIQNDQSEAPAAPQFPFGPTVDEAQTHQQLVNTPIGPPGDIVKRLGQQFQMPAAEPAVYHPNAGFATNPGT